MPHRAPSIVIAAPSLHDSIFDRIIAAVHLPPDEETMVIAAPSLHDSILDRIMALVTG